MGSEIERQALGVAQFCLAYGISRGLFYKLCRHGRGPRTFKVGRRTLVSVEAAREWRSVREGGDVQAGAVGCESRWRGRP